ncbi:poly(3-hydroxybutyrate) depolymerase [Streptosporangium sp. NPDC051023]|uniref:alpha/beta hydrolase family esterase n=1 Tax=Streptosporangium sp. NPDC051023 TaxID=3155410 RepID=UPI00344B4913
MKATRSLLRALTATAATGLLVLGGILTPAHAMTSARTASTTSPGCGTSAPQTPGTSVLHSLTSQGITRTYQLHLPAGYTSQQSWPVVLAFHGRGGTGAEMEGFSKLSTLPAIVAYPNGVIGTGGGDRQAWQGAPYAAPGVDDVTFTSTLLNTLENGLCVDQRRVYATGKSNGGGFTGLLACRMADRIAAIAPVAAAFYPATGDNCSPARAISVIDFHGTGDDTIPYDGDVDRGLPAIQDWVFAWVVRNDCARRASHESIVPDITISLWGNCTADTEVEHVAVAGGGHTWPGADVSSGGGTTTQTIEAHEVLWEFLSRFQLPN